MHRLYSKWFCTQVAIAIGESCYNLGKSLGNICGIIRLRPTNVDKEVKDVNEAGGAYE